MVEWMSGLETRGDKISGDKKRPVGRKLKKWR